MNARWFRDNLSVLIFSMMFIGILGGLLWFLRQASAAQATVVQDLETQKSELHRLQDTKPFPSKENIDVLKRDYDQIHRLNGLMQNAAIRDITQPPELERPIDFSQLMRATVARLTELAGKNNVSVGESFAWGFSRYVATFPCTNPAARGDDCKRLLRLLAKQLLMVEKLSGLLIDNKVGAIGAIHRTEVETGASSDTLNTPITDDVKSLYRIYPFEVQFTADTVALRNFLNALAQAENLYIVRSVHITAITQQVRAPAVTASRPPTEFGEFEAKVPEAPKMIETRRLNVTVRLDVIEFPPVETRPVKR